MMSKDDALQAPSYSTLEPHSAYPVTLDHLLALTIQQGASDLHLTVGSPPLVRVDGELTATSYPPLGPESAQHLVYSILTDEQLHAYERRWELDFTYTYLNSRRFRVNLFRQRGHVSAVLRTISWEIPTLTTLGMPPIIRELTKRLRGLVLVTGPTGVGKSTTLAAMIDEINATRHAHILTIEDPIEFVHQNKKSEVNQREVGSDTRSFATALRHMLRQDPDVILIGEMRDHETVTAALTAAETGHLVLASLHTATAAQTIDRIVDVFPPNQQDQIRQQLAGVLDGIIAQTLLTTVDGHGRVCAQEILLCTPAIRTLIREGKIHQIPGMLQSSAKYGMQSMDHALRDLVLTHRVSLDEAMTRCSNPEDFKSLLAMR